MTGVTSPGDFRDRPPRTGDLEREHPDGRIERLPARVERALVGGHPVDLDAIGRAIARHPGVAAAAVALRLDSEPASGGMPSGHPVAYLVPSADRALPVLRLLQLQRSGELPKCGRIELPNGLEVFGFSGSETRFMYQEIFEERCYLRHGLSLEAGACVVDVGANIGMFSLFAGCCSPGARIYACEPIPRTAAALRANTTLYGLDTRVLNLGLAGSAGEAEFTCYSGFSVISSRYYTAEEILQLGHTILGNEPPRGREAAIAEDDREERTAERMRKLQEKLAQSERITCRLATLSEIIRDESIATIDLLKVDAEKSELDVLRGISELDWRRFQQVVVEVHDLDGRCAFLRALLERQGFVVAEDQERLFCGTEVFMLYARRPGQGSPVGGERERDAWLETTWCGPDRLIGDIRRALAETLPSSLVPAAYILRDEL